MTERVTSDQVGRLLFDMYALIEHVRSMAPATRVDPETWRASIATQTEQLWDDLVATFYRADPAGFREAISAIIDAANPITEQLQNPQVPTPDRLALIEDLMREYERSILTHTDEHGVLRADVAISLDRALHDLRTLGQHAITDL